MGAAFSTFAQSTAADAEASVESGMWGAAWNASPDGDRRAGLVERRTRSLERRVGMLERQLSQLRDSRTQMNQVAYRAQLATLTSQLVALGNALNQTEAAAEASGVNTSRLDAIRSDAAELAGPDVADMARELGSEGQSGDALGLGQSNGGNDTCETQTDDDIDCGQNGSNESLGTPVIKPGDSHDTTNGTDGDETMTSDGGGGEDADLRRIPSGVLVSVDEATVVDRLVVGR
jgi:hypothetical protein